MKTLTFILPFLIALPSCGQAKNYDLAVKTATVGEMGHGRSFFVF